MLAGKKSEFAADVSQVYWASLPFRTLTVFLRKSGVTVVTSSMVTSVETDSVCCLPWQVWEAKHVSRFTNQTEVSQRVSVCAHRGCQFSGRSFSVAPHTSTHTLLKECGRVCPRMWSERSGLNASERVTPGFRVIHSWSDDTRLMFTPGDHGLWCGSLKPPGHKLWAETSHRSDILCPEVKVTKWKMFVSTFNEGEGNVLFVFFLRKPDYYSEYFCVIRNTSADIRFGHL